ncbi:N-acetylmuramoyl-L-alanine amidase [Flavobacterium sp. F-380]|uniref:N-acetylmuramoyl-L-alanine amidase n=1 Tax=Flavobacterium kayseriense TaxID=2764714 RepID=A0ABR7J9S6_9FLAO|nr:N-acetylmuramoyl-L-alanine amidase [Flavobacterium kayseriense]MBC5842291.1 N-acetylmuramoyl-L-alanine amidase [Flavobacterium kayseriense]MBC5848821.1 N-acetylmuramoyl-L-alanine amidase [Flavobacterium kayseriense]MBU0940500.1 N-acetylmuramoyl-L-alanine amidase [Bacteroidota bacterium]
MKKYFYFLILGITIVSCSTNPYKDSEKVYDTQLNTFKEAISIKEPEPLPIVTKTIIGIDNVYTKQLYTFKDTISKMNPKDLENGIKTEWIGTVNFNLRKPNFIIIHHTAQDSIQQTIKTFTLTRTQVSAHYVIADNGNVVQMLNDYLRAWHAGRGSWGRDTDINSSSIGIELDNNGSEPFSEAQITSLMALLSKLKKQYDIPVQNIIGHSDIAPTRKTDPSVLFPWKILAENGFGLWADDSGLPAPVNFDPILGLRIIGYDTKNLSAAIKAFKLHYIQTDTTATLDEKTVNTIYAIYQKM